VRSLLNLILEAPLDDNTAKKMLDSGKQVSVYYQGDDNNPKGWRKIEPVRVDGTGDDKVFVAYEIPKETSKKPELKKFVQKKIINWNILSTTPATIAAKEKEKDKKAGPTKPPKVIKRNLGSKNDFCDAILNKRVVKMYYKGDKENEPGWRTDVEPVAYGSNKGIRYIRAWVGGGKSVSGEKGNSLPGWRFFREDRIQKWEPDATKTFKEARPNFNPKGDDLLPDEPIICMSDFKQDAPPGALQESQILPSILEAINIF
jgi:predicted DNA-binding transcriptional regulator YafY